MPYKIEKSVFVIYDPQQQVCGAGFLLAEMETEFLAVSCASVIEQASLATGGSVRGCFIGLPGRPYAQMDVMKSALSSPASLDLVFLRLPKGLSDLEPLLLANLDPDLFSQCSFYVPALSVADYLYVLRFSSRQQAVELLPAGDDEHVLIIPAGSLSCMPGSPVFIENTNFAIGMVSCQNTNTDRDMDARLLVVSAETIWKRSPVSGFQVREYRTKKIDDLYSEAQDLIRRGEFNRAIQLCYSAITLEPDPVTKNEIEAILTRAQTENLRLERVTQQAHLAEASGKLEMAIQLWEQVLRACPMNRKASNRWKEINERIREIDTNRMSEQETSELENLELGNEQQRPRYTDQSVAPDKGSHPTDHSKLPESEWWDEELHADELKHSRQDHLQETAIPFIKKVIESAREAEKSGDLDLAESLLQSAFNLLTQLTGFDTDLANEMSVLNEELVRVKEAKHSSNAARINEDSGIGKPEADVHEDPPAGEQPASLMQARLAYPKLLSKRYSSTVFVYLYPKRMTRRIKKSINEQLNAIGESPQAYRQDRYDTEISPGVTVTVKIESPGIEFLSPASIHLSDRECKIIFTARPNDTCETGKHKAKLSVCDKESGVELFSAPFQLHVVDFVFDHVSRPFVYNLATALSGLSALFMFILTLLGQIDTTFGLTSGAAASFVAAAVFVRFTSLFQRTQHITSAP